MAKSYKTAAIAYGAALLGFTGFLMLDTFVLSSAKQTGATEMNLSLFAEETKARTTTATEQTDSAEPATDTEKELTAAAAQKNGTVTTTASGTASGSGEETQTGTAKQASVTQKTVNNEKSDDQSKTENTKSDSAKTTKSEKNTTTATTVTTTTTTEETEPEPQFIINDTAYQDENISIALSQYIENDTSIYVADVHVSSAQFLKTAFANDTYGKNITAPTSDIAAAHGAILAINGDFYGTHNSGYVIRNGVLYRDTPRNNTDFLSIMADGSFFITTSDEYSAQELLDMGAWQCFMFGPRLIENGAVTVDDNSEVARAMASNPRTAIGIVDDLHYLFVVSDGRTSDSDGLSLSELAYFMQSLGAYTAYNLDGGGSSTMIFNGSLINNPTTSGRSIKERSVSDIVYIGY